MNNFETELNLSIENSKRINYFETSNESNFVELVKISGLDPRNDFRYSNLSNLDFSNSDIRGFDFFGANLSGCYGVQVKWDESTNFRQADVEHSIFSHYVKQKERLRKHPEWNTELERLKGEYWANAIIWFGETSKSTNLRALEKVLTIGFELFRHTNSTVVKSNILFFSTRGFRLLGLSHRDFLVDVINQYEKDSSVFRSAFSVLCLVYSNDEHILDTIRLFINNKNENIRMLVYYGLLSSRHSYKYMNYIDGNIVEETSEAVRIEYLKLRASRIGDEYYRSVMNPYGSSAIDFAVPIGKRHISLIARNWVRADIAKEAEIGGPFISIGGRTAIGPKSRDESLREVEDRTSTVYGCLIEMIRKGIPIKLNLGS